MRTPYYCGQFKRDLRTAQKRGKDMDKLRELMQLLIDAAPLAARWKDHPLKGRWSHFREAHIEPDWLLIYKIDGVTVRFERNGRHADLFDQ
ncbi:damage-inducible protein [Ventosimonas gracilis]|uniref:Damage-inducible protein n=1 Tax=Ventosimonas gracilis TaxID=1680762 RepID=A0A139SWA5_9GAMM|nr:type II toxin-antitoxin system mRNA interferase toxin, RelE/StbE family [Ventosimonas gracilis]KXU38858.1 damage-inducible protein [Ventosimonas gracilis]